MKNILKLVFAIMLISLVAVGSFVLSTVQTFAASTSCVVLYHKGKGSVRAVAGTFSQRNRVKRLARYTPRWTLVGGGKYQSVFCISRTKIRNLSVVTVIGQNGHYTFRGSEINALRTTSPGPRGPFGRDDIARMWSGG